MFMLARKLYITVGGCHSQKYLVCKSAQTGFPHSPVSREETSNEFTSEYCHPGRSTLLMLHRNRLTSGQWHFIFSNIGYHGCRNLTPKSRRIAATSRGNGWQPNSRNGRRGGPRVESSSWFAIRWLIIRTGYDWLRYVAPLSRFSTTWGTIVKQSTSRIIVSGRIIIANLTIIINTAPSIPWVSCWKAVIYIEGSVSEITWEVAIRCTPVTVRRDYWRRCQPGRGGVSGAHVRGRGSHARGIGGSSDTWRNPAGIHPTRTCLERRKGVGYIDIYVW